MDGGGGEQAAGAPRGGAEPIAAHDAVDEVGIVREREAAVLRDLGEGGGKPDDADEAQAEPREGGGGGARYPEESGAQLDEHERRDDKADGASVAGVVDGK